MIAQLLEGYLPSTVLAEMGKTSDLVFAAVVIGAAIFIGFSGFKNIFGKPKARRANCCHHKAVK